MSECEPIFFRSAHRWILLRDSVSLLDSQNPMLSGPRQHFHRCIHVIDVAFCPVPSTCPFATHFPRRRAYGHVYVSHMRLTFHAAGLTAMYMCHTCTSTHPPHLATEFMFLSHPLPRVTEGNGTRHTCVSVPFLLFLLFYS